MKVLGVWLFVFTMFLCRAQADEGKNAEFSGLIKCEKYHASYDVNSDGTHSASFDKIIKVLTEEGIKSANQLSISYSESLKEVVIGAAYTLKKDGRRINVPSPNIQDRSAVEGENPMFSDIKSKVIIFPDVGVGDRVACSYKIIQKVPMFPGNFLQTETFSKLMVFDDVRISLSVPAESLKLYVSASGVQGGRVEDKDGRWRWVWTYKNEKLAKPEVGSVDTIDYSPKVVISSFKDYASMAAAYEERARPKSAVTDKVRSLAAELTRGITDEREKAKVLYTWVAQNIKFAGNVLGIGSVVPHDVNTVLANRLGDCKDHTALLQALLAAEGIESTPVLINSGFSYTLTDVPSMRILNHVINYIPSIDVYADSSSEYTPFGQLPLTSSGKPAIHTTNFSGIRHTPHVSYKDVHSKMKMVLTVHEDGSAEGETNNEETGILASSVRAILSYVKPNVEDLVVRTILSKTGYAGTGTITKADPRELSSVYAYGLKYQLHDAFNVPGPGAISISPIFPHALPIAGITGDANLPQRTFNFGCFGGISKEEYTFHLPKNVKVVSLPKDVHFSRGRVVYDSTYRLNGNTITINRTFEERIARNVCTPEEDQEFKPIAREILKDLNKQILYQPAENAQQ